MTTRTHTKVRSLDAAGQRVVDWLDGHTSALPSHLGPPVRETLPIADDLRALNTMGGVVTDNSQPGRRGIWGRQRATVQGIASAASARLLRERARDAGLLWEDHLVFEVPHDGSTTAVTQGVTRGLLGDLTCVRAFSATTLEFMLDSIDVPAQTVATWHTFSCVDPIWGRRRLLWDALLGKPEVAHATSSARGTR